MEIAVRNARQMGEAIRRLRHHRGWTQADLAVRCGHKQATISEIESGLPGARDTLYNILTALDLELAVRERAGLDETARPDIGSIF